MLWYQADERHVGAGERFAVDLSFYLQILIL